MKTVAIIGASNNRSKFGNKSVRAHQDEGWKVFPVNINEEEIEGLKVYKSILDITEKIDRVSVYLPPAVGMKVIDDLAKVKASEVFFNPGSEDDELVDKAKELGISPILACSIVNIGRSPSEYN